MNWSTVIVKTFIILYLINTVVLKLLFINKSWIFITISTKILSSVMNLVPTHSNCTSPMDYISHHALHSHIPVHHYTNHTAVTIHSSLWLPHHTCTSFSHSHKSSTQTLTQCEVLFSPGYISERSPIHPAISVFDPGLPDLGTLNLCLWPRPLPGIVYVSALPLIFLLCPLTIACVILPLSNKHILLHLDPLPLTSLYKQHDCFEHW